MNDSFALIVQIVLGLLVIFFFVAVFFSARTWRWPHLLFLVLCFFAFGTFAVLAISVSDVRSIPFSPNNFVAAEMICWRRSRLRCCFNFKVVPATAQPPQWSDTRTQTSRRQEN